MPHPSDSENFTDLSGITTSSTPDDNPYNALLEACNNDPVRQHFSVILLRPYLSH